MTKEEIFRDLQSVMVEALHIPDDKIIWQAKLIDDLGMDSLDLLDLLFQMEQKFNIRLSSRDFENRAKQELGETPVEINDVFTPQALERLRRTMPEVPPEELLPGLTRQELPRRFRVATLVNWVVKAKENHNG